MSRRVKVTTRRRQTPHGSPVRHSGRFQAAEISTSTVSLYRLIGLAIAFMRSFVMGNPAAERRKKKIKRRKKYEDRIIAKLIAQHEQANPAPAAAAQK